MEVYARFLAVDQDSGRVSYLISRRTGLRVTDLVQPLLRVADPKIATLRGRTLQGRAMGRTDVQVCIEYLDKPMKFNDWDHFRFFHQ